MDKAGTPYWDQIWEGLAIPSAIDPRSRKLTNHVYRGFHKYFARLFKDQKLTDQKLLEIGCGRSKWLPYFAREFGFQVTGLDYSEVGCQQAEAILEKSGVKGKIVCADLFAPPQDMLESFDVVVSFGVVEHFTDTAACLSSISKLLKPGGLMITSVPNIAGWIGSIQKTVVDRSIYDVHVPIDREMLDTAHKQAGLSVQSCEYFLSVNWGVMNTSGWKKSPLFPVVRRLPMAMSMPFWLLERAGVSIKPNRRTSPYIICVARKPAA